MVPVDAGGVSYPDVCEEAVESVLDALGGGSAHGEHAERASGPAPSDLHPHEFRPAESRDARLHHVRDRTGLEDRHGVGSKKTGAVVTMLRSVARSLVRKAHFKGLNPHAYCPERIECINQYPQLAVDLVRNAARF